MVYVASMLSHICTGLFDLNWLEVLDNYDGAIVNGSID